MLLTSAAERDAWLSGSTDDTRSLLGPSPAEVVRIVQEGFDDIERLGL